MLFSKVYDDGDDAYAIEEVSDDEWNAESSDDDDGRFEAYMNERQRNCADDFLDEMKKELDETVAQVEVNSHLTDSKSGPSKEGENSSGNSNKKTDSQKFYDPIYFDSDSDSDSEQTESKQNKKQKKKHPIPTDDDLFYDPNMDDDNQKWIDDYRRSCQPKKAGTSGKPQTLPNSDAVLNCPACMTLLCLDCQRHALYSTQYRAMFVQNCKINFEQTLNYPLKSQKKHKSSKSEESISPDVYHPVKCDVCNTEVAVYDKDEVYHFFNVIPSYT